MNTIKIDWRSVRKPWNNGVIDLIKALNTLPDVQVKGFNYVEACDYLLMVESLQEIASTQVAALAIANALEIGYRTCKPTQE